MESISLRSLCVSLSVNKLSFHGGQNSFKHSILLRPNDTDSSPPSPFLSNNAPIQVVSDVPQSGVALNSFMKVLQPESGHAMSAQIWPDNSQKTYAHLQLVEIDMFGVQVLTPVTIDFKGVHFDYMVKLFDDNVDAHVVGNSVSTSDWEDIVFNVSAEIPQDQDFVTEIESSLKVYTNSKINLLSNRLSNLQSAQEILLDSITEQNLRINHSGLTLDSYTSQYAQLLNAIDKMESEHAMMELAYKQSQETNSEMYDNLRMVCDIQLCEPACLSMPVFKEQADFDYIKEWKLFEGTELEEQVTEISGMAMEKQWMVNEKCRPVTIIADWGKTVIGQECSYQSNEMERMQHRLQLNIKKSHHISQGYLIDTHIGRMH